MPLDPSSGMMIEQAGKPGFVRQGGEGSTKRLAAEPWRRQIHDQVDRAIRRAAPGSIG